MIQNTSVDQVRHSIALIIFRVDSSLVLGVRPRNNTFLPHTQSGPTSETPQSLLTQPQVNRQSSFEEKMRQMKGILKLPQLPTSLPTSIPIKVIFFSIEIWSWHSHRLLHLHKNVLSLCTMQFYRQLQFTEYSPFAILGYITLSILSGRMKKTYVWERINLSNSKFFRRSLVHWLNLWPRLQCRPADLPKKCRSRSLNNRLRKRWRPAVVGFLTLIYHLPTGLWLLHVYYTVYLSWNFHVVYRSLFSSTIPVQYLELH